MVNSKINVVSLTTIISDFPEFNFVESGQYYWSAEKNQVNYDPSSVESEAGLTQLIHELGHALLNHRNFTSAVELLKLERAWVEAKNIATRYGLKLNEELIEDALNTYRDWVHKRSLCPECGASAPEVEPDTYRCFNCSQKWQVPISQASRCYRMKI